MIRIRVVLLALVTLLAFSPPLMAKEMGKPVYLGLDAEFGHASSTSAEAIRRGAQIAIDEINAAGGVLGGRPLELVVTDNRSVPPRAADNIRELAAKEDLVAVMTGKFSPVVQHILPLVQEMGLPLLAAWSAADDIIENNLKPKYVFRLSLTDTWAVRFLVEQMKHRNLKSVGLMLPNTGWGRSSLKAAETYFAADRSIRMVGASWYNWGDKSLLDGYRSLLQAGADAILLIANETEGSILTKEMAALPESDRRPIFSHWGITGGQFFDMAGPALASVSLSVVQTYSFLEAKGPVAQKVTKALADKYEVRDLRKLESPVGVAHAYDLTHILARAIDKAGSTDRKAVRNALENLGEYKGLIRTYRPPFTPDRHEALVPDILFLAQYDKDGTLVRQNR